MKLTKNTKVIALNSNKAEGTQVREKHKVYNVIDTKFCAWCGVQYINIGTSEPINPEFIMCTCGGVNPNNNMSWTIATNFAPLTEDYLKQLEKEEEYELCRIVHTKLNE